MYCYSYSTVFTVPSAISKWYSTLLLYKCTFSSIICTRYRNNCLQYHMYSIIQYSLNNVLCTNSNRSQYCYNTVLCDYCYNTVLYDYFTSTIQIQVQLGTSKLIGFTPKTRCPTNMSIWTIKQEMDFNIICAIITIVKELIALQSKVNSLAVIVYNKKKNCGCLSDEHTLEDLLQGLDQQYSQYTCWKTHYKI